MQCPRCDAEMAVYTLENKRSLSCNKCHFVGISIDHTSERRASESWAAALDRFRTGTGLADREATDAEGTSDDVDGGERDETAS
ncbi:hypothetical protein [Halorientalis sp.]|uniref:hypothetical protein n=1 Tax=Halorientalis sp. TaxID=1931229 RepID=UPI0026154E12|nr:hypothetical protein [Halorientalis sp.]